MKGLAVQTILSIALAVMFIIAAALIIHLLFPYAAHGECIKGQRLHIEEIESYAKDAKMTGTTYITKFKVEDCVECMWYNGTHVLVRWTGMSTTEEAVGIEVSASWNIGDNEPINDKKSCSVSNNIKGGTTWVVEIGQNDINFHSM